MDVSDLARRLLRRRFAVLLVLVLAVVAGAYSYKRATPTLQTTAAVVIVPPAATGVTNPLLQLDSNLAQLATVLATAVQSPAVGDALTKRNANGTFTVSTTTGDNPSFAQLSAQLQFTVSSTTAADARRTASALVTEARAQLTSIQQQAGVPVAARASLVESVAPGTPTSAGNSALRAAGSIFLALIVLGLLAVLLYDQLATRRTRRREGRRTSGTEIDTDADTRIDTESGAAGAGTGNAVLDQDADTDAAPAPAVAPAPVRVSTAPEVVDPPAHTANGFSRPARLEPETDVDLGPEPDPAAELDPAPDPAEPVVDEPVAAEPVVDETVVAEPVVAEPSVVDEPSPVPAPLDASSSGDPIDLADPELELPPELEPEDEPHLFAAATPAVFDPPAPEPGPSAVAVLVASRVAARSSTALRSR